MGQDLYFEKFVEASTPKFGEWAERWGSREPRTIKQLKELSKNFSWLKLGKNFSWLKLGKNFSWLKLERILVEWF